jgi:hypothetical protein
MPRSSVVLTPEPLTGDAVVAAAGRVWSEKLGGADEPLETRVLDGGAVLQLVAGDAVVLSVLRPRLLPRLDEVARLLPGTVPPEDTQWWTDAYTPWSPEGAVGVAILDAAAEASRGLVVHQSLAPDRTTR